MKVGDYIFLSGEIITARDQVHKYLYELIKEKHKRLNEFNRFKEKLKNAIIYHCGPVCLKENSKWIMKACGPTTSIREEDYTALIIEEFEIKGIIGKGGMGEMTSKALKKFNANYFNAIGGAAQYYAERVQEIKEVEFLNFGIPEAMWTLEIKDFPVIITMDSSGANLHNEIEKRSFNNFSLISEKTAL